MKKHKKLEPGTRFGRLSVIDIARVDDGRRYYYACVCDCGNQHIAQFSHLTNGSVSSCGCLRDETRVKNGLRKVRHGQTKRRINGKVCVTPEYAAYSSAKGRCTNPKNIMYKDYGGRSITFNFKSFEEFYAALGPKPEPKHLYSLNRIDNDGPYEASNVEWAIAETQLRNRRNIVLSEEKVAQIRKKHASGVTQKELAKEFGVTPSTISDVVRNIAWQPLLDADAIACIKRIGNKISSRDLAEAFRVSPSTIEKLLCDEVGAAA